MTEQPTILVTGSRAGIGRALAEYFLGQGWKVVGCSRHETDLVHPLYRHYVADVSDEHAVHEMFVHIRRENGHLDALVNNAGMRDAVPFVSEPPGLLRRTLEVNVVGTANCCKEAAKLMQAKRTGRIVNLSSIAVRLASPGMSAYSSSKAAVEQLGRVLAREFMPWGITINTLRLSFVAGSGMYDATPEPVRTETIEATALGRPLTTAEVCAVVRFLVSADNGGMTGQILQLGDI
jgi:3-oxoacyl-[acyl-carrier protein] reductase